MRHIKRRQAIIDIARKQFLASGYSATSMSLIAENLGGSKGTLWRYFPSKEALFKAVIEHEAAKFRRELIVDLDLADDLQPSLLRFCRRLIQLIVSPDALALRRVVTAEAVRFPDVGCFFYSKAPARLHSALAEALKAGMTKGLLREADPLEAAEVLAALCHSRCYRRAAFALTSSVSLNEIDADAALAVDIFLRSYQRQSGL
ncbi:TetR/AcrR family transcriptional regulator [Sphingopyxis indica]|uniref:TetR/AcrR family transcriptional regulator n=1 Tax=Sphingopyxis indica TaxID=436663 RepID=UPI001481D69A|nr:TetR/AcrR family transcriptional regulator [Sphingopyxis indica]WOF45894.1 TetR/AcrR family transcriptional regulator [Sphingopyxis indica]